MLAPFVPRVVSHLETWSRELIAQSLEAAGDEDSQPNLDTLKQIVGLLG